MNDFLTQAIAMKALKNGGSGGAAGGNAEQIAKNKADIALLKEGITDLKSVMKDMYRIRKKRNGTIERVNLVKHQLFFMDDILILGTNAKDIHKAMKLIIQKADEMGLKIKDSWMVYTTIAKRKDDGHFIDIMGVRIYRQHITIRRRVFLRVRRSYKKAQSLVKQRKKIPVWLARKCMSYKGILDHTDSYNIKRRYNANKTIQICKGVISHESKIRHYTRECYC